MPHTHYHSGGHQAPSPQHRGQKRCMAKIPAGSYKHGWKSCCRFHMKAVVLKADQAHSPVRSMRSAPKPALLVYVAWKKIVSIAVFMSRQLFWRQKAHFPVKCMKCSQACTYTVQVFMYPGKQSINMESRREKASIEVSHGWQAFGSSWHMIPN